MRQGSFVFLNVGRLAKLLKPLFNHKLEEGKWNIVVDMEGEEHLVLSTAHEKNSWRRLREQGILDIELARALWPNGLSDVVLPIIKRMDLAFPLGSDDSELVVLQQLPESRPENVTKSLNHFRNGSYPILEGYWKLAQGAPPGMIENILTRCCVLGDLRTFWRHALLVMGNLDGDFALVLEFKDNEELELHVHGNPKSVAPWMAFSFAMSATLSKILEFPGLRREARLHCPAHRGRLLWMSDQVMSLFGDETDALVGCTAHEVDGNLGYCAVGEIAFRRSFQIRVVNLSMPTFCTCNIYYPGALLVC